MAKYYDNSLESQRFQPGTTVRADEVDAKFDTVASGFSDVEADVDRSLKLVADGSNHEVSATATQRRNKVVGFDSSGAMALLGGFSWRGNFTADTDYFVNDVFRDPVTKNLLVVDQRHTSGQSIDASKTSLAIDVADVEEARSAAESAQGAAESAQSGAQSAQAYAAEWSNKPEDALVSSDAGGDGVDDYSALHHAAKAAASASSAANSESSASASESAAAASELAASESESNAADSAVSAAASADAASLSEVNAENSASSALASESSASDSANLAAASEASAASSAASAASSADDAASSRDDAQGFASNAANSATAASNSAGSSQSSATSAASSATAADNSASSASTSATNAANSESAAATSASNAALSESNAATSESNAATSAANAATSESNAASSATAAANSASAASTSESNAASSEIASADSASAAATSETNAADSESNAAQSASAAATSETNAANSASSAAASETEAASSASAALASEVNAAASEVNAAESEGNAASSASAASSSAAAASASESNAAASESAALDAKNDAEAAKIATESIFDTFDDRFLGSFSSDPSTDNDGNAIIPGAVYYNTADQSIYFYNGAGWDAPAAQAETSASNALDSENAAAASASAASTSEANALASASAAAASESAAESSAQSAADSEQAAASSQSAAAASESSAAASAASAQSAFADLDDRYLGAKSAAPSLDNNGDPLSVGAIYYDTAESQLFVWDGGAWERAAFSISGTVTSFNGREGTVTLSSGDVTDAIGFTPYDAANPSGYISDYTVSELDITQHESAITITESQISDLQEYLTSVSFDDLTSTPTTLSGYGITDAATSAQGDLADSAVQPGDNISSLTNDAGYTTNVGDITAVTAGTGLTGGGASGSVTVSHADTSTQGSVDNSGGTVVQDVTLDGFGHVTGLASTNLDSRYLQSYTETDTLDSVTDRGASTTNNIAVGGVTVNGNISVSGTVDGRNIASDGSKLDGIEVGADVTDSSNVAAAGALMDSEIANLNAVKNFNPSDYATSSQGSKADSAVQPSDLASVATSGAYSDLSGAPAIPAAGTDFVARSGGSFTGDVGFGGAIDETVFALSGTTPALDPANGTIQTHTLSGNTTYSDSLTDGQSLTLLIDDGSANTITWPSVTWKTDGGDPPTLNETGFTAVVLWKVGTTLYGARVGDN